MRRRSERHPQSRPVARARPTPRLLTVAIQLSTGEVAELAALGRSLRASPEELTRRAVRVLLEAAREEAAGL
jgi:hypothetical protein